MSTITLNGITSGSIALSPPAIAGSVVNTLPSTSGFLSASPRYRFWFGAGSGTYTVPSDVSDFYVFVAGSTGGIASTTFPGGVGGAGYSEKYYTSVTSGATYSYSIGGGGSSSGTAGGTTTFGTISITGSGGVTGTTGSSGGVATGGDFNANGGSGGNGTTTASGGGGGPGTRAGNGGNGAAAVGSTGGGGGGTGGNNASGSTGGSAATAKAGGALTLPFLSLEYWLAGNNAASTIGGAGAPAFNLNFDGAGPLVNNLLTTFKTLNYYGFPSSSRSVTSGTSGTSGNFGQFVICEVLK